MWKTQHGRKFGPLTPVLIVPTHRGSEQRALAWVGLVETIYLKMVAHPTILSDVLPITEPNHHRIHLGR